MSARRPRRLGRPRRLPVNATGLRETLALLNERGRLSATEAGQAGHARLGYHAAGETCDYCQGDGAARLARLVCRGLALPLDAVVAATVAGEEADGEEAGG